MGRGGSDGDVPLLHQEVGEVLRRDKFRRWLALEDVEEYLQAVTLLSEEGVDPPSQGLAQVCRDSDDDYLIFLAEHAQATLLISGDNDLLSLQRPGLDIRSPRDALDGLSYQLPWGRADAGGRADSPGPGGGRGA